MVWFCAISNCVHAFQNWPVARARYTVHLFPLCWIILQKPDDQYQSFNLKPLWPILGSFIVLKVHMQNIDKYFTVEKRAFIQLYMLLFLWRTHLLTHNWITVYNNTFSRLFHKNCLFLSRFCIWTLFLCEVKKLLSFLFLLWLIGLF